MNETSALSSNKNGCFLSGYRTGFDPILTVGLDKKLGRSILVNKFGLTTSSRGDLVLSTTFIVIPAKSYEPQSAVHHYTSSFCGQETRKIALFYRTGFGVLKVHILGFTANCFKKMQETLMEVI